MQYHFESLSPVCEHTHSSLSASADRELFGMIFARGGQQILLR